MTLTRRSFIAGIAGAGTLGSISILTRPLRAAAKVSTSLDVAVRQPSRADYTFTQFHNQSATSSLHKRLVEMWGAIRTETSGRVDTQVFAENNLVEGSDPAALKMLLAGEIQFFTLMGGILGNVVPAAEVQQMPFAFRSAAHAHKAMDGGLGAYLREEMAAKGIFGFPVGAFDNGMRQIGSATRPIRVPDDLAGIRMRIPAGQIFADTFKAFGAIPIAMNSSDIYEGLKSGKVEAQENPLALLELFKIYEVVKHVSMTNHMWSGFNLMAHLATWKRVPDDIKAIIERNVTKYVRLQREDQETMNAGLREGLARRGLVFYDVDQARFRAKLSSVYTTWKKNLGTKCWSLLEAASGALG